MKLILITKLKDFKDTKKIYIYLILNSDESIRFKDAGNIKNESMF